MTPGAFSGAYTPAFDGSRNGAGGALALTDVRARAAAALEPVEDTDPAVIAEIVDAVDPPALMLSYEDPWITPMGVGCLYECRLEVICVGARVEPGPGILQLEQLVVYALARMAQDAYSWALQSIQAPRIFTIGGVPLLAARIVYSVRVSL